MKSLLPFIADFIIGSKYKIKKEDSAPRTIISDLIISDGVLYALVRAEEYKGRASYEFKAEIAIKSIRQVL